MGAWCEHQEVYVPLVIRAATGNRRAFEALVRRYYRLALGYADSILRDYHMAQDAVQEAFLAASEGLPGLREPAAFPGWLRRIVFSRCDRMRRRASPTPIEPVELTSAYPGPEELAEGADLVRRVAGLIDGLPPAQREAAELCFIDGYSPSDVACFLEVNPSTVRKRLHDARARLRHALQEEIPMQTKDRTDTALRELFAHRISDDRLEKLLASPSLIKTDGEVRELTVMFADMVDMVGIVSAKSPSEIRTFLNTFFTEMSEIVLKEGGFLDKMVGDMIMAIWGTAANPGDHATGACYAALAMQKQLRATRLQPQPRVAIGIHSGEAIIGNFGPPDNVQYTPMGDHVNFGAMLEDRGRTYGVHTLVSEVTRNLAGSAIRARRLDVIDTPRFSWPHRNGESRIGLYELVARGDETLPDERRRTLDAFDEGLEAFDAGEFGRARGRFVEALAASGGVDGPSLVYLNRCAEAEGIIRRRR